MQKLQLSIPEPCHENWQQMTPTEQGRFCKACAKEVIDFSMMSDTEVLNYFSNLRNENVCGRALQSQLDRPIRYPKEPKKRLFWYWNYLAMFLMFFSKSNSVKAQGDVKPSTECSPATRQPGKDEERTFTGRKINGKVTDMDGNGVAYASVFIKGTRIGTTTDTSGRYALQVQYGQVLIITALGFAKAEIHTGVQSTLMTPLQRENHGLSGEVVVTVGGMRRANPEDIEYTKAFGNKATLRIIDEKTGSPVAGANIFLAKNGQSKPDKAAANKKGLFHIKNIGSNEHYFLKVDAAGYEAYEFEINGGEFSDRNKEWEVALRKKDPVFRLGQIAAPATTTKLLYVVDGKIDSSGVVVNPDDVDEYRILHGAEASALFGQAGMNGALLVTTRKSKEKELQEVIINSFMNLHRPGGMMGSVMVVQRQSLLVETKASLASILGDSIRLYPNPVQRGQALQVKLRMKVPGTYHLQVADASGRIVFQQQLRLESAEQVVQVQTGTQWSGGLYYIRVYNAENRLMRKSSFIVQ